MTPQEIEEFLIRTLEAQRLTRGERQTLAAAFEDGRSDDARDAARSRAFAMARNTMDRPEEQGVLDWLEAIVKDVHQRGEPERGGDEAEAHFSPGDDCHRRIVQLFSRAQRSVDVCVFTITDDRITAAILDAHRRRIPVRVITDNEKAFDEGSDIERLRTAGVDIRVDRSPYHMHHKFAIFDGGTLLTGSYNWTRGASAQNFENLVVLHDTRLIDAFHTTFERLWTSLHDKGS